VTAPVEVRRFLHCNYNCTDIEGLERFYVELFDLKPIMRGRGEDAEGVPFGIYDTTRASAVFLYDHRGGRRATSLELVKWELPETYGSVYPNAWNRGIQSAGYSAPDLDVIAAKAASLEGQVIRRGSDWLLLRDPEGVAIEVIKADGPCEARYLRIVVSDMTRTLAWWSQLGFADAPQLITLPANDVWAGDDEHSVSSERAMVGTDDPTFGIIFTTWSGSVPSGPTYALPYHRGLYRMAMAVDDVHAAYAALHELGVPRQTPYTFQLPGTKLTDGLTILFIREPDGILVELVDRPRQP
jgi:catechol 2,3-dioxygenase-like lactoylglutathione lyase family enzyme